MVAGTTPERGYDSAYYAARESWGDRRRESRRVVATLRDIPAPLVLDIGCGSGPLFPLLRRRGFIPLGLEINAAAAAAARRLGNVVRVGGAVDLPLRDAVAGAIVAQHLIEHLPAPLASAREWRRVLRGGGVLALLTPNARHPDPALFADPDHRTIFDAPSLADLLRSAGFGEVRVRPLFPYFGRSRGARALSRRLWPLAHLPPFAPYARTLLVSARKRP